MNKKEAQEIYMKSREGYGIRHESWPNSTYEYRDVDAECIGILGKVQQCPSCFNTYTKGDGWEEYYEIPEGFTRWEGGECPVDPDGEVRYMLRFDDMVRTGNSTALMWSHNGSGSDIIAYKVIREEPESTCETCRYEGGHCETHRSNRITPCGDWEPKPVEKRYEFGWDGGVKPHEWHIKKDDVCFNPGECVYLKGFKYFIYSTATVSKDPYLDKTLPTAAVFEEGGE